MKKFQATITVALCWLWSCAAASAAPASEPAPAESALWRQGDVAAPELPMPDDRKPITRPFAGLDLLVELDAEHLWPRILHEMPIDMGRHHDLDCEQTPHASRRHSPIDFGMIMPVEGKEPEIDDMSRTWTGFRLALRYKDPLALDAGAPRLELAASRLSPAIFLKADSGLTLFAGNKYVGMDIKNPAYKPRPGASLPAGKHGAGFVLPAYYAVKVGTGAAVKPLEQLSELPLENLESGWLLAWFAEKTFFHAVTEADIEEGYMNPYSAPRWKKALYRADCPLLLLFGVPVVSLARLDQDEGLTVLFGGDPATVAILPVFGEYLPHAEETAKWAEKLPEEIVRKCDWWAAHMRGFPVDARESYAYDSETDTITIAEQVAFEPFRESGAFAAPVPPMLATAFLEGFPIEFSSLPHDPELVTLVGSYLALPGADKYEMRFKGLGKYVDRPRNGLNLAKAPERLSRRLNREVEKILEAGHLAPWMRNLKNIWASGFFPPTQWLIHANPGETLYFLSAALPFLEPETRAKTVEYLKRERAEYPPEKTGLLKGGDGVRREAYEMSPHFLGLTGPQPENTINQRREDNFFVRYNLIPPETLYHMACYYEAAGADNLEQDWPGLMNVMRPYLEQLDWATGGGFQRENAYHIPYFPNDGLYPHRRMLDIWYGNGGVIDANNMFAATVGLVRLARMKSDRAAEAEAWGLFARAAALRFSLGKMAAHLYRRGLMTPPEGGKPEDDVRVPHVLDEYGMTFKVRPTTHFGSLIQLRDAVPELGLFARDFLKPETERYYGQVERNLPEWWLAWTASNVEGENSCAWPQDGYQIFMAHAWVYESPAEWLEKHLDVPWQARGDLFYLHKLVETLRAYCRAE